ncbi:hypothetical protein SAMN05660477_02384 [Soonwooa buanensis]|uniref:Uncharacterized protein n=1 Tax=Soonwooa buanensis TaxID=619805 RepID=A0A1T5FWT4_9FLAO|nr:hypothetical protein [Soonwooa buanensis]SKC00628.1 hypothetical protein SAMN05660477_02384 [Soonwooa buanensis]
MKKIITFLPIAAVLFPMLIYLNPFIWGMKRMPIYRPSVKTSNLISDLNAKYSLEMQTGNVVDTLWYFRDLKSGKITKKQNFDLELFAEDHSKDSLELIKKYVVDFDKNFEHRQYFDSLKVKTSNRDSVIYKTKIQ